MIYFQATIFSYSLRAEGKKVQQLIDDYIRSLHVSELVDPREVTYSNSDDAVASDYIIPYSKDCQKLFEMILRNNNRIRTRVKFEDNQPSVDLRTKLNRSSLFRIIK